MSCNSAIYTVNNSNTTVTTSDETFVQVPLGSVVRRFGRNLTLDGDSIIACGYGYYDCECSLTYTPSAAGTLSVQLYQDGMPIPGATASQIATAGGPVNLGISSLIRNCGCNCNSTISAGINLSGNITNLAIVVEKI